MVQNELVNFVHACSFSTTVISPLCVCRYDISQHPEVERKVVQELDLLGLLATPERPNPRSIEYADLSRLTYLNCVIKVRLGLVTLVPCFLADVSATSCFSAHAMCA